MKTKLEILKRLNELNEYAHSVENDGWGGLSCMHNSDYASCIDSIALLKWVLERK